MKRNLITTGLVLSILALSPTLATAGDDPSIQGQQRASITKSMENFIGTNTAEGQFIIYDPVDGKLRKLTLDKLHSGIVRKGDFFVSCADFHDAAGDKIDIDFLVGHDYVTYEAVIHSINSAKRPYHLED